ncbi:hypothetical protein [uncultured Nocardioides sp.]|uniref:hypothetical protein n=1 Tax=uncultured Nocardioides sp. TaxID=198441 RepID=UPI0026276FC2|nr:hypothetical protein [uncultured Nocardioides sp.]
MRSTPRWTTALAGAVVLGVLVLGALGASWYAGGGRWFVTSTPSMGTAMPVGTLLLTRPTTVADTEVGDVVTFRSPGSGAVFTHRVVRVGAHGLRTRGDVNGARDSWRLTDDDLVGGVAWSVPVLGWLVRAVPPLVACLALVCLLTRATRDPARRRSWRVLGASVVVAGVGWWLSPWVGMARLGEAAVADGEEGVLLQVVSTGLLPIEVRETGGDARAHLLDGQVGELHLTAGAERGAYGVDAVLDLPWWGWTLLGLACLGPLVVSVALGTPVPEDEPAHG